MVLGRITRGRHTDNLGGHHSVRTNQQSTSTNSPILCRMPFLSQPCQFILAWDRHRNMLHCIPCGLIKKNNPCRLSSPNVLFCYKWRKKTEGGISSPAVPGKWSLRLKLYSVAETGAVVNKTFMFVSWLNFMTFTEVLV